MSRTAPTLVAALFAALTLPVHANSNRGTRSEIVAGQNNTIDRGAANSTIAGGNRNRINRNGKQAIVAGGQNNLAGGTAAFAAGNKAQARHSGTFVWGDGQSPIFGSTAANQFLIRAQRGVGINTNNPRGNALSVRGNTLLTGNLQVTGSLLSGSGNTSSGAFSAVGGGQQNTASGDNATVGGGTNNTAADAGDTVAGGTGNAASGPRSTVGGGINNTNSGEFAFIGGGNGNTGEGIGAVIAGGFGNTASGAYATIGGGSDNKSSGFNATIGGGLNNTNSGFHGTIAGGLNNTNTGHVAAIGGGELNQTTNDYATVAGGYQNKAGEKAAVGGGVSNAANGAFSFVGGGALNTNNATHAMIPGGLQNTIATDASYSFAAGRRAQANHAGCFVWADSTDADFGSGSPNQFLIRAAFTGINRTSPMNITEVFGISSPATATYGGMYVRTSGASAKPYYGYSVNGGGNDAWTYVDGSSANKWKLNVGGSDRITVTTSGLVGIGTTAPTEILQVGSATCNGSTWVNSSDRNLKTSFRPVDGGEILRKVARLPISEWTYKSSTNGSRHVGPTAQDFREAFGLGDNDKTISTIDPSGVALAAIQGLVEELKERDKKIEELRTKSAEVDALKAKLEAVEKRLNYLPPAP